MGVSGCGGGVLVGRVVGELGGVGPHISRLRTLLEVWGLRIALVAGRASRIIVKKKAYLIYHH